MCGGFAGLPRVGRILMLPPADREPSRFAAHGQAQKHRLFAVRPSGPTCCGRGPSALQRTANHPGSQQVAGASTPGCSGPPRPGHALRTGTVRGPGAVSSNSSASRAWKGTITWSSSIHAILKMKFSQLPCIPVDAEVSFGRCARRIGPFGLLQKLSDLHSLEAR